MTNAYYKIMPRKDPLKSQDREKKKKKVKTEEKILMLQSTKTALIWFQILH